MLEGVFVDGREDLERADEVLVDVHHRPVVVHFSAVVRCGEDGDEAALGEELVAVEDDLVRADDEVDAEALAEVVHHTLAEELRHATLGREPVGDFLFL